MTGLEWWRGGGPGGCWQTSGVRLRLDYAGGDHAAWRAATEGRPLVYMANHRSLYDVAALLAILDSPVRFLTKRSLFRVPGFGWGLRAAGFVRPVDREDRSRAAEDVRRMPAGCWPRTSPWSCSPRRRGVPGHG